ncbi:MAG: type II toxin-antitoxin system VapC family toxin [Chloroflexota bacterium]
MPYLLDTHAFLWFIGGDERLPLNLRTLITDPENDILLSIASLWEIAIKTSLGKLSLGKPFTNLIPTQLAANTISVLPISLAALNLVTELPFHHRDPFDRLIIAQAITENLPILSKDAQFSQYSVTLLW